MSVATLSTARSIAVHRASTRPESSTIVRLLTSHSVPRTAHSMRPPTSRPQTAAASSHHESSFVVAIVECRGIGREVGIAALDMDTGQVDLLQLTDCQTYVKTLHHLHLHYPSTVLVPDTFLSPADTSATSSAKCSANPSLLVQCIRDEFPYVPVEPVLRKYWNEETGLQFIDRLCSDSDDRAATLLAASSKYYALSAACALFKHAETRLNTRYASHSLRIRYAPAEGTMLIDSDSARNLELVGNMINRKSTHSLFGVLNHTWTAMGSRLLRVNLLAPITAHAAISARLDAVEELVQTEDRFTALRDALRAVNNLDLDKLVSSLAASEACVSNAARSASARVSQMLQLRNFVKNIPMVRNVVEGCHSRLLEIVYDMLSDERFVKIERTLSQSLNDDAISRKGGGLNAVNSRAYALKETHPQANQNCLLDVARETYKENIADIFELNRALCHEHGLPLQLVHQEHGFVFTLRKADLDEAEITTLPKGFINAVAKKGRWFFESIDLKKRNARMKDALEETLMLTDRIIREIVAKLVADAGALYKASEAIALLDMLWSFAHSSIRAYLSGLLEPLLNELTPTSDQNYVRPEFTGTLAIKAGRHPVLEKVHSSGSIVPNDVYCCDSSSFQIIQGPNMSGELLDSSFLLQITKVKGQGKSTYLRQIGLLTVMAMCGCFVPAVYASFRIHDALFTRLSNDDHMERNLSTFAEEMSSSAMIIGLSTSHSLVLIDELGRGTSPREGLGITHAIAGRLIITKAFVFFVTHFGDLTTTLSRQPSVVNLHLSIQNSVPSSSSMGIVFNYKIVDGVPDSMDSYGLELARLADFSGDILAEAHKVSSRLSKLETARKEDCEGNQISLRRKAMLRLRTQLTQTLTHSSLPCRELVEHLSRLQRQVTQVLRANLDDV